MSMILKLGVDDIYMLENKQGTNEMRERSVINYDKPVVYFVFSPHKFRGFFLFSVFFIRGTISTDRP